VSRLLCRLISAARRLWPLQTARSSPTLLACRFTIRAALADDSAASDTLPPGATARNTGPALISAAANHVCTAQSVAAWDGDFLPLPFLIRLRLADQHAQIVRRFDQIGHVERHKLGSPERSGDPNASKARSRGVRRPRRSRATRRGGHYLNPPLR
jgi:hypothetical protein